VFLVAKITLKYHDHMKICIHRGANQIGGSCVEIEFRNSRIVLDVGLPLDSAYPEDVELPDVPGFLNQDLSLLGIIISHPHQDHYGLISRVNKDIPIIIGEAAQRILEKAGLFTGNKVRFISNIHLSDNKPFNIGPFRITPFLMDHSAFDSYAILVEAGNKKLLYTGDLRAHGRKRSLFYKLVNNPPSGVNVLLMEGTTIGRTGNDDSFATEYDAETEMVSEFCKMNGIGLVMCSSQNIDRLITVFKSCVRSNKQLIIDMYAAEILKATGNPKIPQADWSRIRVFLPENQKRQIKKNKAYNVAAQYRDNRIYPEELKSVASMSVMNFRPSMMRDLEKAGCVDSARLFYSMWDGYLKEPRIKLFLDWLSKWKIPLVKCHTSGHAPLKDLRQLRNAFQEAVAVPIHTDNPERFTDLFGNVAIHKDGEWWEV